jgi:hypothetical protein
MPDICNTELATEPIAETAPAAQPAKLSIAANETRRDKGRIKVNLYLGCKSTG